MIAWQTTLVSWPTNKGLLIQRHRNSSRSRSKQGGSKTWPLKGGSSLAHHAGRNAWAVITDGLAVVGAEEGAGFRRKCC